MLRGRKPPHIHENKVSQKAGVTVSAGEVFTATGKHDDAWSETIFQQAVSTSIVSKAGVTHPRSKTRSLCWPSLTSCRLEQTMPWQSTNPEKCILLHQTSPSVADIWGRPLFTKRKGMHFAWFWSNCFYFVHLSSTETHNCFAASA